MDVERWMSKDGRYACNTERGYKQIQIGDGFKVHGPSMPNHVQFLSFNTVHD